MLPQRCRCRSARTAAGICNWAPFAARRTASGQLVAAKDGERLMLRGCRSFGERGLKRERAFVEKLNVRRITRCLIIRSDLYLKLSCIYTSTIMALFRYVQSVNKSRECSTLQRGSFATKQRTHVYMYTQGVIKKRFRTLQPCVVLTKLNKKNAYTREPSEVFGHRFLWALNMSQSNDEYI